MKLRYSDLLFIFIFLFSSTAGAQTLTLKLWPDGIPDSIRDGSYVEASTVTDGLPRIILSWIGLNRTGGSYLTKNMQSLIRSPGVALAVSEGYRMIAVTVATTGCCGCNP